MPRATNQQMCSRGKAKAIQHHRGITLPSFVRSHLYEYSWGRFGFASQMGKSARLKVLYLKGTSSCLNSLGWLHLWDYGCSPHAANPISPIPAATMAMAER